MVRKTEIETDKYEITKEFLLSREAVKMSGTLTRMIDDQSPGDETRIPIPDIDETTMKHIIKFIEYHKDTKMETIPRPLPIDPVKKIDQIFGQWDKNFIYKDVFSNEKQHNDLINLNNAAHFLDIVDLFNLCSAAMAIYINSIWDPNDKQKFFKRFGIDSDFTEDEENKIRDENPWILCDNLLVEKDQKIE